MYIGSHGKKRKVTLLDVPKRSKEMRIKIISITFSSIDVRDNGENGSFGVMPRKSYFLTRRFHGEKQLLNGAVYPYMIV